MTETIFALSSGAPPAAIGIVRISGPQAGPALRALAGRLPAPRRASLATLHDPVTGDALDRALLLWFPGPATATGEDLAEIHCHGGRAVVRAIENALARLPSMRMALPGEFTRRAFAHGRIDLNEAEGLADLLFAETESQRRAALAMSEGHFSRRVATWRLRLLTISALVEACLDFSDEDDVPDMGAEAKVHDDVRALQREVAEELKRASAERLRDGVRVVIAGPPNAGKSTLLNRLVGRDAAIVSDIAGTTRDRIEVPVSIDGIAYLITDTAGLRDVAGDDVIEWQGVGLARDAMERADLILWLGEPNEAPQLRCLIVATKADLLGDIPRNGADLAVSAVTGEGMDALLLQMRARASALLPSESDYALHARQRAAVASLAEALAAADAQDDMLLVAEHLRAARLAIDALTGRAGTEDMLDALFGGFCIGK